MSKLTANLITGVLLVIVGFMIHLNYRQSKIREKENSLRLNELAHERDSARQLLKQSKQQRVLLNHTIDSLHNSSKALVLKIEEKDRQIKQIPGRYKNVPQDSLGKLMDRRANGK
jgi:uncharacterized protein YlxW (UPF0749 family)